MNQWKRAMETVGAWRKKARSAMASNALRMRAKMEDTAGQGTTEYAILVGVLVVIAIIAITAFRPNIEALWTAITEGINGL
ncbi:hypothetical protein PZH32_03630 [Adlercreutzia equolifaciens]|uniref:hypothetical protein n=1 Tax=Adlercreutzia equolifaciens TaxID=446660 RepID=UPI0023AF960E|nr:hypothetical protein [Adlercreutzia equolifaciens]MDE8702049.1 hypothetical protein [Adlercreutzia equolifaciens]